MENKFQMNKKLVFLGGTCAESTWRNELISKLKIDYFNPVVEDWTPDCQDREIWYRENCDFCLYVITPRIQGFYSFAELAEDSVKRPSKTIFCYYAIDGEFEFNKAQIKSLNAIGELVERNGGKHLRDLDQVADYLNSSGGVE